MAIPVIDLSPLRQEPRDPQAVSSLAAQVDHACRETGFLYVSGHALSQADIDRQLALVQRLFALPQGSKEVLDAAASPLARGYNSLAHGRHNCTPEDGLQDVKESFTLGVERAAGDTRPPSPMHGPNQWPPAQLLPGWREEALAAFGELLGAARLLMRALALATGQPEDFFTAKCRDPVAQMVMFRYPPTGATAAARGCGAHTDCGFLTFVAQDAPGIEVQLGDGSWLAAPCLPGTLLVNLGDLAQRWTGGAYRSTVHRVVNRGQAQAAGLAAGLADSSGLAASKDGGRPAGEGQAGAPDRHSIVFFCNCDFDALVETIPTIAAGTGAAAAAGATQGGGAAAAAAAGAVGEGGRDGEYAPVKAGEYILQRLGLML